MATTDSRGWKVETGSWMPTTPTIRTGDNRESSPDPSGPGRLDFQTCRRLDSRLWAIISAHGHVETSQARAHQGRAVQHVPGQGDYQAGVRQPAEPGSDPQHAPSRHRARPLDLRNEVRRVR